MLLRALTVVVVLGAGTAFGQTAPGVLEHHARAWAIVTATGHWPPSKRLRWWAEVQPRLELITEQRFDAIVLRAAFGFDVGAGWSIWLGTAWTPSFNPTYRSELRPSLQVLGEHPFGRFRLMNRFRTEERFLDKAEGLSIRMRHMVRGAYQLGDSPYSLVASDELFVTLNKVTGGPAQGLDQNRFFIGANRSFGVPVLEAGYLATYVWRAVGPRLNHTVVVWLAFNVP